MLTRTLLYVIVIFGHLHLHHMIPHAKTGGHREGAWCRVLVNLSSVCILIILNFSNSNVYAAHKDKHGLAFSVLKKAFCN